MTREPPPHLPAARAPLQDGYAVHWHLVVPVKETSVAKSRLVPPAPLARPELARAMARDTLEAACGALPADQVVVVTSDAGAACFAHDLGARVVPDPGAGLDAAVAAGWAAVPTGTSVPLPTGPAFRPGPGQDTAGSQRTGWAALLGDLPALRATDLSQALVRCAAYPDAVVPDEEGTGTVLLTSTRAVPRPRFGPGSAARHAEVARVLALDLPRLRRDVDTAADLEAVLGLGVGRHTSAVLARLTDRA